MSLYEKILNKREKLALVGLGYVGMPIAVEFAKHINVIGFDINAAKIKPIKTEQIRLLRLGMKPFKLLLLNGLMTKQN